MLDVDCELVLDIVATCKVVGSSLSEFNLIKHGKADYNGSAHFLGLEFSE